MRGPDGIALGDSYCWYYYPRWNYYRRWHSAWEVTSSPGYWEPSGYVIVESSRYDARRDRLLCTARSATMEGRQFEAPADSIANEPTQRLVELDFVAARETDRTAAVR